MTRKILLLLLSVTFCFTTSLYAQKSNLHQRAEAVNPQENIASARSLFIHAFNDYSNRHQTELGVECAVRGAQLYYKENYFQEAFDLLRRADMTIDENSSLAAAKKAALHYQPSKERMQIYIKMHRMESAREHLKAMENYAAQSGDDGLASDLLYSKAIFYYTFGQNQQGNAVFKEMADKLTRQKEYGKVDEVYRTLIANGRKAGSANMVAQSYSSYMEWKDSVNALKSADEIAALKKRISEQETAIADRDSSLTTRQAIIVALGILALALAAALAVGAVVLLRFVMLSRKQKRTIQMANESNAQKARFISNISAQLRPTLEKLDQRQPEVQSLLDFASHVETLSYLENADGEVELEDVQVQPFSEQLADQVRPLLQPDVTLTVSVPKMTARLNSDYVSHVLLHLLRNAAEHTANGGTIVLDFKKRSAHTHQFMVSNTGEGLALDNPSDVFTPFREVRDLTGGDGLGLPICRQMALRMNGDLSIDEQFTKGVRFVLELHA